MGDAPGDLYERVKLGIALDKLSMAELDLLYRQLTTERSTDMLRSIFWELPPEGLPVLSEFMGSPRGKYIVVRTIRMVLEQKRANLSGR